MDESGINAAIIHPPGWDPNSDNLALEAARLHPNRLSILGKMPLEKPESRAQIAGWKDQPGMLGLRFSFTQPHQKSWPTDGTMDWLWPEAAKAGPDTRRDTPRSGCNGFPFSRMRRVNR